MYMLTLSPDPSQESFKVFFSGQTEEVNAVITIKGSMVASGSYDGSIMVIRSDTGQFYCRLNPAISHLPLKSRLGDGDGTVRINLSFINSLFDWVME
jgi:hypothetical protein